MTTNTSKNNGRVNWEQIKRTNREKWDEYHHEDGELSTLALLRGIHKIQEKGGSGADEQAFLDRVGFKPIQTDAPTAEQQDTRQGGLTHAEAVAWAAELDARTAADAPAADASDDEEDSTSGTKEQLQARIRLLEQQLLDAASSPHVDERAFQAHVDGRVAEAVAAEYERSRAEIAALRRECVSENRLLEAVLQKFDVSLEQAKQALVEYDAKHVDGATPANSPVNKEEAPADLAPADAMLRDPSYVAFERIATRGLPRHRHGLRAREARRRHRKGRKGAWCAP